MRSALLAALLLATACTSSSGSDTARPSDDVDPLIGSGGAGYTVGSIPPGPALPFGFVRPGPDTALSGNAPNFSHCGGYWYEDSQIRGFSQLHAAGIGVPDYGVLMLMPALDLAPGHIDENSYIARLDHHLERASAGYYSVDLVPSAIKVELSAGIHTAIYRLTYPNKGEASAVVDLAHGLGGTTHESELHVDAAERELTGSLLHEGGLSSPGKYRVFFVMRFDHDFADFETYSAGERTPAAADANGPAIGAILHFGTAPAQPIGVEVAVSFIDLDTARANLEAETFGFDLDKAHEAARAAWDRALGVIEIEGGTDAYRRRFRTALYQAQLMPSLFTENGKYRGLDGNIHQADGFNYYTDFSLWDTFRTQQPLTALIAPDRQSDFVRSLLAMTHDSGRIPKWPLATVETDSMIGYHGETVLVDSFLKGIPGIDAEALYTVLRTAAMEPGAPGRARDCLAGYMQHGYCPSDQEGGSASKTLENAFDDFVLSRLAEKLGHTEDAQALAQRAKSWSMIINERGYAQGRASDGSFGAGFREDLFSDEFVEGNSRQWTLFVPHDVPGLAEKLGGADKLAEFLDAIFTGASTAEKNALPDLYYWHGNEPDIHAAYMFAEAGRPDLTGKWVRWIIDHRYANSPAGLDGNDDGGTLSSWYVFSALGIYPKVAEARYVLGAPLFPRATLHLPGGKSFVIRAEGWSERAIYVKSASLNGVKLETPFVSHEAILAGGELVFQVSEEY